MGTFGKLCMLSDPRLKHRDQGVLHRVPVLDNSGPRETLSHASCGPSRHGLQQLRILPVTYLLLSHIVHADLALPVVH